ncbi:MAG: S41 family peptidase [Phycisphaerales bacterium]|jgi:tricorn protease|nr:S41 family peptidase [Phycisphaerales bacterium]
MPITSLKILSLSTMVVFASAVDPNAMAVDGWYEQPALSGNTLVFASEGDLWIATLPDGETDSSPVAAHRLTSGSGVESHPVLNADGSMVAYSATYDGNDDVYLMPTAGGVPTRLTYHPGRDVPVCFSANGRRVAFRSARSAPQGNPTLYTVSLGGGLPKSAGFGPCSLANFSSTGKQIVFTPWSNETSNWKGYRGGTAPDLWIGVPDAGDFRPLTDDPANDLFPMFVNGRIVFLSDRAGEPNLFSIRSDGSELRQVTTFEANSKTPTAIEGYELRWPSPDRRRGAGRVVFSQGGGLAIAELGDGKSPATIRRLAVSLVSDRARARVRTADALDDLTDFSVSPDGRTLLLESRGDLLTVALKEPEDESIPTGVVRQITKSAADRERSAAFLDDEQIVLVTDRGGEQQLGQLQLGAPGSPYLLTDDRVDWLLEVVVAPDGKRVAISDRTGRLHLLELSTGDLKTIDRSEAGEITDIAFSGDSMWLAFTRPMPDAWSSVAIHAVRTGRTIEVSNGLTQDGGPRFSRDGRYLFFLSDREFDPTLGTMDFEHVFLRPTQVWAIPLLIATPPPLPEVKDLTPGEDDDASDEVEDDDASDEDQDEDAEIDRLRIDADGLIERAVRLGLPAGNYEEILPIEGGLLVLDRPTETLLSEVWPAPPLGAANGTLHHFDLDTANSTVVVEEVSAVRITRDASRIVLHGEDGFGVVETDGLIGPIPVDLDSAPMLVDAPAEWAQILDEAWRLQRDFFWNPALNGIDWDSIRIKYQALLSRVGNRAELNRLIGAMIAELGTSHTYVWGGDVRLDSDPVDVGLIGADLVPDGPRVRLRNILRSPTWSDVPTGALGGAWQGVEENDILRSIDGEPVTVNVNPFSLLQNKAGDVVELGLSDEPGGTIRMVKVRPTDDEAELRYLAWVEGNRAAVEKASDGRLGYLHIPDMDGVGLSMFGRLFNPQVGKDGMLIDVRGNAGGFVSQMIIARLARKPWAYSQGRHGAAESYPARVLAGPRAVLIDQFAGSDGDIFPESFRLLKMGPLIGTRTWGGVVGIRADKPTVDGGITTQPEYAWWEPVRGWSLENSGVAPDIKVELTPTNWLDGVDPQLDRGIRWLLEELEKNPIPRPTKPPYPGD